MKVLTLLNSKGGVGKSTLATHIAAGLSLRGFRVLIIDTDPQGNSTTMLGHGTSPGVYDLIVRCANWIDVIREVSPEVYVPDGMTCPPLALVPGNHETQHLADKTQSILAFRKRLTELQNALDFVVFDTMPTPSMIHASILLASDYVIYPVELDYLSTERGLNESKTSVQEVQQIADEYHFSAANSLAIVPNKYRQRTVMHNTILNELRGEYGAAVWEPLSLSIVYQEAVYENRLLYAYPGANGSLTQINGLVDRVLSEVMVR